jgi:hypothetical protein
VNAFTGSAAMHLYKGYTWSRTYHTHLFGSNRTKRHDSMAGVYLNITDEITLLSQQVLGCGSLNARIMNKLFGGMSCCICGGFQQLSVGGGKVYNTGADRAKARAKTKNGHTVTTAGGAAASVRGGTCTAVELEAEGEGVWQSLNAAPPGINQLHYLGKTTSSRAPSCSNPCVSLP